MILDTQACKRFESLLRICKRARGQDGTHSMWLQRVPTTNHGDRAPPSPRDERSRGSHRCQSPHAAAGAQGQVGQEQPVW